MMNLKEQENKFKKLRHGKTEQLIIKFIKKFIKNRPCTPDFIVFLDSITKSYKIFSDFVIFVNHFNRESKSFRLMCDSIIYGHYYHVKYKQYYRKIVIRRDKKLYDLTKNIKSIASDSLILKGWL